MPLSQNKEEWIVARTGRPKVPGESVYVRLDPEVAEALDTYVESTKDTPAKVSKTSVINHALKVWLQDNTPTL